MAGKITQSGNPKMLAILGILLVLLGIIGLITIHFMVLGIITIVGALLIIGGIITITYGLLSDSKNYGMWPTVIGGVVLGVGIILLLFPQMVATILALFMGLFFIISSLIAFVATYRDKKGRVAHALVGSGNLLLGVFVLLNWPENSDLVLGLFISIDLFLGGIWLFILANSLRNVRVEDSIL